MDSAVGTGSSVFAKIGRLLGWAYFGFFGFGGIALAANGQIAAGVLIAASAIFAFPILPRLLPSKLRGSLLSWVRVFCAAALFIAASLTMDAASPSKPNEVFESTFVVSPRGATVAKLLLLDDFTGYIEGRKVVADWFSTYPIDVRSTAPELFAKYHANEVAADDQFKDKRVAVSGQISSINKDMFSNIYLVLRDANPFEGVHAELASASEKYAASLSKGEDVSLVCTGSGMVIGSPILKSCELTPAIVRDKRPQIEAMVDALFAGETGQPEIMRTMIGLGYAMGSSMPAGDACERAAPGQMTDCVKLMRSAPKAKVDAEYQALAERYHLGPRPIPK